MSSSFSWLDYSEKDKREMLEIISRLQEKGTRDELGIGAVRDAFAEMLFPGTSTVQTRARYFFFIPWIYARLERRFWDSAEQVAERVRRLEIRLVKALVNSDDGAGTIGSQAGETLKRLPSNIYWHGLQAWGLCLYPRSQGRYHQYLTRYHALARDPALVNDDREPVEERLQNWAADLPPRPEGFPKTASFAQTGEEAECLQEKILGKARDSLLAFFAERILGFAEAKYPWEHPLFGEFTPDLVQCVEHARNFSVTMHGAALLYNLILAELVENDEWIERYRDDLRDWASMVERHRSELSRWGRTEFWGLLSRRMARARGSSRKFIDRWLDMALADGAAQSIADSDSARDLIRQRETSLKPERSRIENPSALRLWNGSAGTRQLDYRWGTAQNILVDVKRGLQNGD